MLGIWGKLLAADLFADRGRLLRGEMVRGLQSAVSFLEDGGGLRGKLSAGWGDSQEGSGRVVEEI